MGNRTVIVAGAGIAGLTSALAFAAEGVSVVIYERAEHLEEIGAGLQISPNATRILKRFGVLGRLRHSACQPSYVKLKAASDLKDVARVPLGEQAEKRWGAPYLVAHRADLQRALLDAAQDTPQIEIHKSAEVKGCAFRNGRVIVTVLKDGATQEKECDLLIGADGVWSSLRSLFAHGKSAFSGRLAFRTTFKVVDLDPAVAPILDPDAVTAFLAPGFHLVAYPIRGGDEVNLVAVTRGEEMTAKWSNEAGTAPLRKLSATSTPSLATLLRKASWTAWPIHTVEKLDRWVDPAGLALIGDAAHALTPYAAQGAAMAIEDAALLAALVSDRNGIADALRRFEGIRCPRLKRVARRGSFNRFVWHSSGPLAIGRNLVLRLRSEADLAADLDWLYGYDMEVELARLRSTI